MVEYEARRLGGAVPQARGAACAPLTPQVVGALRVTETLGCGVDATRSYGVTDGGSKVLV